MVDYDQVEKNIIEEKPYNWKKHFLFQLPETFGFVFKTILIFLFFKLLAVSIITSIVSASFRFSDEQINKVASTTITFFK